MSERIRGSYDDALYKSTYTLLTLLYSGLDVVAIIQSTAVEYLSIISNQHKMILQTMTFKQLDSVF